MVKTREMSKMTLKLRAGLRVWTMNLHTAKREAREKASGILAG